MYENYMANKDTPVLSTISKMIKRYIEDNYIFVHKPSDILFVPKRANKVLS